MFMIGGHVILEAVAGFVDLAAGGALVPTPQHVQAGHVVFQDVLSLAHLIIRPPSHHISRRRSSKKTRSCKEIRLEDLNFLEPLRIRTFER